MSELETEKRTRGVTAIIRHKARVAQSGNYWSRSGSGGEQWKNGQSHNVSEHRAECTLPS